jgi:pimeloyl-ACP methyl ester carboxylesterase
MLSAARYGQDRFAEVEGYRVHYVEAGNGHPVILIPGSMSTYRAWNRMIPLLSSQYRLLALDYVGTGDSDKPKKGFRYTIQEQADLVARMIQQLGLGQAHLIGVSYGGAIVLNLAARYPHLVGKVVSIEGGVVKPKALPGSPMESAFRYPLLGDLLIGIIRTGLLNPPLVKLIAGKWYPHMTAEDRRELLEQLRSNAKSASRIPWYWINISHRTVEEFEEAAKSMRMPILYLYGKESDFTEMLEENIRFFETCLPHVRIVGLDGGIHDLEFQKPQEVADLVLDFLGSP